jgi:soluble lytic murein transglycosylase-like protein
VSLRARDIFEPEESSHANASCLDSVFFSLLMAMLAVLIFGVAFATQGGKAQAGADCQVSNRYPTGVRQWCKLITKQAEKTDLHPDLVAALIWQESGGNSQAYSHSGAVGLMQVMPRDGLAAEFMCNGSPCFSNRPTIRQLKDPSYNVKYGTEMLKSLLEQNAGNLREALRQYGPMDVGYSYADRVLSLFHQYSQQ